jgi:hypothetical protein
VVVVLDLTEVIDMPKLIERCLNSSLPAADFLRLRYPRLIYAMRWVAILSQYEASYALRDYLYTRDKVVTHADLMRCGGGEAVVHFGSPREVIQRAIKSRWVSRAIRIGR